MLEDLLRRFHRRGDAAAMEAIVRRTRGRLLAIARRIGAPQDAEDSVQAAYHALLRRATAPDAVEAWLTTTVVRIAYRRKAVTRQELQLAETLACDGDPHLEAARREEGGLVRAEVARLPARYRDVLVLRWLEGLSVRETARLLDLPDATVKTRSRRGKALLRARVAPWAAHTALVIPWLFADSLRSAAKWGVFMNVKTTVAMSTIVVAAAAVGLGVGVNAASEKRSDRRSSPATRLDAAEAPSEAELTRLRVRAEQAEAELAVVRTASSAPAGTRPAPPVKSTFEARYAAAGRELGVSAEARAAVSRAQELYGTWLRARTPEGRVAFSRATDALEAFGGEGFLAGVAHLRAADRPGDYVRIFSRTWEPGLEHHLQALAQDPSATSEQRERALRGLSVADTPAVRDFLLAELGRARLDRLVSGAAQALGWLKEERAAPILERLLYRRGKERQQDGILNGLGTLGSEEARRILVDYIARNHGNRRVLAGVRALAWSDQDAARTAAREVLADPRSKKLDTKDRRVLESAANR